MAEHNHQHSDGFHTPEHILKYKAGGGKKKIVAKVKGAPGLVYFDRQIHDDAIVISASLTVDSDAGDLHARIAEELEAAAREVKERGGIVGHIKASVSAASTCMISVTDEEAAVKDSPIRRARITLAAIVFLISPEDAESIVRRALAGIRGRLQDNP